MKKLVKNAIAAAMVFAATMMNTVNAFAADADTLENGDAYEATISPDGEEVAEDNAFVVENWMLEDIFKAETAETFEVESWMTENMFEAEAEAAIVENWMTEDIYAEAEAINNVEDWMLDTIYASEEEEIQLEAWMF